MNDLNKSTLAREQPGVHGARRAKRKKKKSPGAGSALQPAPRSPQHFPLPPPQPPPEHHVMEVDMAGPAAVNGPGVRYSRGPGSLDRAFGRRSQMTRGSPPSSALVLPPRDPRRSLKVHRDSFHGAMRPALVVAQCFALLPVNGVARSYRDLPHFRWLSLRVLYTLTVFLGTSFVALLAALRMISVGLSFTSSVNVVFFGNSLSAMLLFLFLARRWPEISLDWYRVESDMRAYGHPRNLGRKIKIMTAVVLLVAAVEHLLAVLSGIHYAWPCYSEGGFLGLVRGYTINSFAMVLQVTDYALWKAILVFVLNVVATFSWNYTDLFIMLMSVCIAERFKQLNKRLHMLKGRNLHNSVWKQLRQTFNSLSVLTKTVDKHLNHIVLLSFASNLCFICIQLLQGMKQIQSVYHHVYLFYSFGYLLVRTTVVSLYAASIHDESREPARILNCVPDESYCPEVRRFQDQVHYDEVALTGGNFFSVTRALMLTVAGTIVTYEVVLVQFNGDTTAGNDTKPALNTTVRCF